MALISQSRSDGRRAGTLKCIEKKLLCYGTKQVLSSPEYDERAGWQKTKSRESRSHFLRFAEILKMLKSAAVEHVL